MVVCVIMEATYTVHIEPGEAGGFIAYFPALPGCHTQGRTIEEVITMAKDALTGYLEVMLEDGEPLPVERPVAKPVGIDLPLCASVAQ